MTPGIDDTLEMQAVQREETVPPGWIKRPKLSQWDFRRKIINRFSAKPVAGWVMLFWEP
jgi:hypothetical protein